MIVYRLSKRIWSLDLTGEGARREGGRWNSAGKPMIYTSSSRALALLEILAHANVLPIDEVMIAIRLPAKLRVPTVTVNDMPRGWNDIPPSTASQEFGDNFLRSGKLLAVRVPSVILPEEDNILINPAHPLSKNLEIVSIQALEVDTRLK